MVEIRDTSKLIHIELTRDDFDTLDDGGVVVVECPHTGKDIALGNRRHASYECECCGQRVEYDITPAVGSNTTERLKNGGTSIYDNVHTDDEITIVVRATHSVAGGWK